MATIHLTQHMRFFKAKEEAKKHKKERDSLLSDMVSEIIKFQNGEQGAAQTMDRMNLLSPLIILKNLEINEFNMIEAENNNPFFRLN